MFVDPQISILECIWEYINTEKLFLILIIFHNITLLYFLIIYYAYILLL